MEDGILNSLDFGSRSERKRYFFVASVHEGFTLPVGEARKETPIVEDGVITLDNLNWVTPETDQTLKYFIERNGTITHNHKIASYDICKNYYIGTIPKSHAKKLPENLIRHPFLERTYAFLMNVRHLRYFHEIKEDIYLGDSTTLQIQSIGQGVSCNVFTAIMRKLHTFLTEKMFGASAGPCEVEREIVLKDVAQKVDEQYCFGF